MGKETQSFHGDGNRLLLAFGSSYMDVCSLINHYSLSLFLYAFLYIGFYFQILKKLKKYSSL